MGYGATMDWVVRSGKPTGKVIIQDGGGSIELLGGGNSQPSVIGKGEMQDWFIRSGNTAGVVNIQDHGGSTTVGGELVVAKDMKIAGHIYMSASGGGGGGGTTTLEERLMSMESRMSELMETN